MISLAKKTKNSHNNFKHSIKQAVPKPQHHHSNNGHKQELFSTEQRNLYTSLFLIFIVAFVSVYFYSFQMDNSSFGEAIRGKPNSVIIPPEQNATISQGFGNDAVLTESGVVLSNTAIDRGVYTAKIVDKSVSSTFSKIFWSDDSQLITSNETATLFHFDEESGVDARDTSGKNHNGVLFDGNQTSLGAIHRPKFVNDGVRGSAVSFDGESGAVGINVGSLLNNSRELSIDVWVNPKDIPSITGVYGSTIVSQNDWYLNLAFSIALRLNSPSKVFADFYCYSTPDANGVLKTQPCGTIFNLATSLSLNEWSHIVVVFNGTHNTLYINGKFVNSDKISNTPLAIGAPANTLLMIGNEPQGSNIQNYTFPERHFPFNGSIDELRILNKSLSADEVLESYSKGVTKTYTQLRTSNDGSSFSSWSGNIPVPELSDVPANQRLTFSYASELQSDSAWQLPGLVAHYGFENNLFDDSENKLTAIADHLSVTDRLLVADSLLTNNKLSYPLYSSGREGEAVLLNSYSANTLAVSEKINITLAPLLDFNLTKSFSVSLWFNTDANTNPSAMSLVGATDSDQSVNSAPFRLVIGGGDGILRFFIIILDANGILQSQTATSVAGRDLRDGKWHHAVAVYDATSSVQKLYIDGILEAQIPVTIDKTKSGTLSKLYAGGSENFGGFENSGLSYIGLLDELSFFNRALIAEEITAFVHPPAITKGRFGKGALITGKPIVLSTSNIPQILNAKPTSLVATNKYISSTEQELFPKITRGLVGFWNFESNESDVGPFKLGGEGKMAQGFRFEDFHSAGKKGQAYLFDRYGNGAVKEQRVEIADNNKLTFTNMTITAWVKSRDTDLTAYSSPSNFKGIVSSVTREVDRSPNEFYSLGILGVKTTKMDYRGKVSFTIKKEGFATGYLRDPEFGGAGPYTYSKTLFNDENWHFVTGVRSANGANSKLRLYVDGILEDETPDQTSGEPIDPEKLWIGGMQTVDTAGNNGFFNGWIDQVGIYSEALTDNEIKQMYTPDNKGIVSLWSFQGIDGSGNAGDNQINFTQPTNSKPVFNIKGYLDEGALFEGTEKYLAVGRAGSPSLNISTELSIGAWVNPTKIETGKQATILSNTENFGYALRFTTPSSIYFDIRCLNSTKNGIDNCGTQFNITPEIPLNKWTHITATFNGTIATLYLNGQKVQSVQTTNTATVATTAKQISFNENVTMFLGNEPAINAISGNSMLHDNMGLYSFNGILDEVFLANKALTETEVQSFTGITTGITGKADLYNNRFYSNITLLNSMPLNGTLMFWVKPQWNGSDKANPNYVFFESRATTDPYKNSFLLYKADEFGVATSNSGNIKNQLVFRTCGINTCTATTTPYVNTDISSWKANEWHNVAVSWISNNGTNSSMKMFVDGILADGQTSNSEPITYDTTTPFTNIAVGGRQYAAGGNVKSQVAESIIEDFVLTSEVLSQEQIQQAMKPVLNLSKGQIRFWIKPLWNGTDDHQHILFYSRPNDFLTEGQTRPSQIVIQKLASTTSETNGANKLSLILIDDLGNKNSVAADISSWKPNEWHHIIGEWEANNTENNNEKSTVKLYVDGTKSGETTTNALTISKTPAVYAIGGNAYSNNAFADSVIDELSISDTFVPIEQVYPKGFDVSGSNTGMSGRYAQARAILYSSEPFATPTLTSVTLESQAIPQPPTPQPTPQPTPSPIIFPSNNNPGNGNGGGIITPSKNANTTNKTVITPVITPAINNNSFIKQPESAILPNTQKPTVTPIKNSISLFNNIQWYIWTLITLGILIFITGIIFTIKFLKHRKAMSAPAQLIDYVKSTLARGYGKEQIRQVLAQAGWASPVIDNAFSKSTNA